MSEMVERVARAILRASLQELFEEPTLTHEVDNHWTMRSIEARAAIEATREPTAAMKEAGRRTMRGVRVNIDVADPDPSDAAEVWDDMIDAALT